MKSLLDWIADHLIAVIVVTVYTVVIIWASVTYISNNNKRAEIERDLVSVINDEFPSAELEFLKYYEYGEDDPAEYDRSIKAIAEWADLVYECAEDLEPIVPGK